MIRIKNCNKTVYLDISSDITDALYITVQRSHNKNVNIFYSFIVKKLQVSHNSLCPFMLLFSVFMLIFPFSLGKLQHHRLCIKKYLFQFYAFKVNRLVYNLHAQE